VNRFIVFTIVMSQPRTNPGAWLLLILFSIGHVLPSGAVDFLLCIGCDDTGYSINLPETAFTAPPELCCDAQEASDRDQQTEQLMDEYRSSDCDCVHITINTLDSELITNPSQQSGMSQAMLDDSYSQIRNLDLSSCAASPRGPPDHGIASALSTLLGQRTGLIL